MRSLFAATTALLVGAELCAIEDQRTDCVIHDGLQLFQRNVVMNLRDENATNQAFLGQAVKAEMALYPAALMHCDAGPPVMETKFMTSCTYDAIEADVRKMLSKLPPSCDYDDCPQAEFSGCLLRMVGHDFMDYSEERGGGADACTDMEAADNAGLLACLVEGEYGRSAAQIYADYCTEVSLADFLVIAAEAVIHWSRRLAVRSAGTKLAFSLKPYFKYGRKTATECPGAALNLPDPEHSCDDVHKVFVRNMGLSWEESAALMGVHTLGRAKLVNSGYDGWWSDAKNSRKFNNDYFVSMLANGWVPEAAIAGNPKKNQWKLSNVARSTDGKVMMLNSDLCLAFSFDPIEHIDLDASSQDCCPWVEPFLVLDAIHTYNKGEYCGVKLSEREGWNQPFIEGDLASKVRMKEQRAACCDGRERMNDCGSVLHPTGFAGDAVHDFANNETYWLQVFEQAWGKATTNGMPHLKELAKCEERRVPKGSRRITKRKREKQSDRKRKRRAIRRARGVNARHEAARYPGQKAAMTATTSTTSTTSHHGSWHDMMPGL
eukprot:CAMPEP_0170601580 /NCGR_PEP_ID=MMETSP0224-20130122/17937_1 /TAXON_ID=285029 /ORGANISM="Togula jolla, Strain CCCM 725" /LENGTH=547 /DNA_ID=CAMNT_0010926369 /DNA_START=63 /DNA_END=1706 /DNA_ORIENTATION=-